MSIYTTPSFILAKKNIGEADQIVTILTQDYGKARIIARGIRYLKSKLASNIETLTLSQLSFARGRHLDILTGAETLDAFRSIREDVRKVEIAFSFAEAITRLIPEGSHEEIFAFVRTSFENLKRAEQVQRPLILASAFRLKLVSRLGHSPELYECVSCRTPLQPSKNHFSCWMGGIVCDNCVARDPQAFPVTVTTIKAIRTLFDEPLTVINRLRIPRESENEVLQVAARFIEFVYQWEPASDGVVARV